ncbi:MAG: NrfD/PsrC family molybdoenzyme membrane anchor subunit [Planctomycetota bacterium]|jgi:Ni/Fe-hydrogenase subunit HybB-like protein
MQPATVQPTSHHRLGFWRGMFYVLLALGLVLTYVRFTQGLGAVTNLSDRYPWGLWVGFDLLCGVGLAAGGFVITAAVYIFDIKKLQPIARPAILTAFLGYLLVMAALMFDLGKPWNIWHPLVMWNPSSVMFEVAWCVTLYSTVLFLEFSSMLFEKFGWMRAVRIQKMVSIPLVVAGVVLSTLHQSSLGTLYLIVPGKLHGLWYTPLLPVLFFVSAVSVGLAMTIVESRLSARALGRQLETPLLRLVGRVLIPVLVLFGLLRIGDLWVRGMLGAAFDLSYESLLFLVEFGIGLVVPIALLSSRRVRSGVAGLYAASLCVMLGFITNRLNVGITGFEGAQGGHYLPSWSEAFITLMLIAVGFAAFYFAVRHLNVYPDTETEGETAKAPAKPAAERAPHRPAVSGHT